MVAQSMSEAPPIRSRTSFRRLFLSGARLVDVQSKILLVRAKMAAQRIGVFAGLAVAGIVVGVLAIVFLYIGVFYLLNMALGNPAWSFLIMGGAHVVVAGALLFWAKRYLSGSKEEREDLSAEEYRRREGRSTHEREEAHV